MSDNEMTLFELKEKVRLFCEARDWDQFHGAKDLAIGAVTEASELLEIFRFQDEKQVEEIMVDPQKRKHVGEEISDVLFFLLRMSQRYNIDLSQVFLSKLEKSGEKYPVSEFKSKNHKSTIVVDNN